MIKFLCHPSLQRDIDRLASKKIRSIGSSFAAFEKLCNKHFHPENPHPCIAPGKLHRVTQSGSWTLWKVELVLLGSGLRPSQFPRLWFAIQGDTVVYLSMGTHVENYDNVELEALALERVTEFF